ncbi:MAG: sulfurtransferase TusA family protein [Phycisphaerales bacterium]|nr:MAG: sulfurtransferase TusA family protein [Phycisphaerales bacterium]
MNNRRRPILRLPETVVEDTANYRGQVDKFLQGLTSPVAFRAYRVPMGIYEQRTAGKYMVRIRIGAGLVLPFQLERVAELSKAYGNGIIHVTTRQDIQIHEVNIEDTPDVLERLLEVGLSSRGGGGNTVRNVTACPRAGVCPKEKFDVAPYAVATAEYLLQDRSSFNLPRKYKVVFSGCPDDCAFASVADLGFFAHNKDGGRGFSVYAGGGLGPNPAVGLKIEDFTEPGEIFEVAEAVKRLFDKHGDRANKHRARLRYVLARIGAGRFVELYKTERQTLKAEGLSRKVPEIRALDRDNGTPETSQQGEPEQANVLPEKKPGRYTVRLHLKNGDIPADDLKAVARIAAQSGQAIVRTTQLQDLLITGVSRANVQKVNTELERRGIDVSGDSRLKVVACAGASTCKLGLCLSRGLADAISSELRQTTFRGNGSETVIRISGCPNSCGHHYIAGIGFQGKAKRVNGRLMPCYDVLVDAEIVEGRAHLAEKIGTVPAKRIPALLSQVLGGGPGDKDRMKRLVEEHGEISPELLPEDYYYDYGSDEPFSLAGRGPGECGAGVMDVMKVDVDEAKDAVKARPAQSENVYRAVAAAARALLVTFGLEPKKDREIFAAFAKHLIEPGWVKPQTQQLLDDVVDWRMGEKESIEDLLPEVEQLTRRVEELFLSLDANLKFTVEPVAQKAATEQAQGQTHIADLRGVACPLNFVRAKLELEKLQAGAVLEVLLDEGEPIRNVPASFSEQGQEVLEVRSLGDHFRVKVRRKK